MTLPTWNPKTKPECDPGYALLSDHADRDIDAMEHNYAYIGGNTYTPSEDHAHDGTSSAKVDASDMVGSLTESQIGAAAVNQAALKTATEAQSTSSVTMAGRYSFSFSSVGSYGLWPQVATTHSAEIAYYVGHNPGSGYVTQVGYELYGAGSGYIYAQIRYVQASPPHEFLSPGEDHGGWLFVVRDEADEIRWSWFAMDPPWWLRGFQKLGILGKRAPWRFLQRPHPFAEVNIPPGWRICLVDLRHLNEAVPYLPAQEALHEHEERLQENIEKGIAPKELETWGRRLKRDAEHESAAIHRAKQALDGIEELRARRFLEIARDTRKSEAAKMALREAVDQRLAAMQGRLSGLTGSVRRIDRLLLESGSGAIGLLGLIEAGRFPGLSASVRCVSDDRTHPEFQRIPGPPGLFKRGQDGSHPMIQVVTQ